jgi:hypothetical protein
VVKTLLRARLAPEWNYECIQGGKALWLPFSPGSANIDAC